LSARADALEELVIAYRDGLLRERT
jgi:hypothetical protein